MNVLGNQCCVMKSPRHEDRRARRHWVSSGSTLTVMNLVRRTTAALIALAVSAASLVACAPYARSEPPTEDAIVESMPMPTPAPTVSPTGNDDGADIEEPLTELPEWALFDTVWLVYPEGFKCWGTEGCPSDYRAFFGEPGAVLPEGVEYYDPAVHTWVRPAEH